MGGTTTESDNVSQQLHFTVIEDKKKQKPQQSDLPADVVGSFVVSRVVETSMGPQSHEESA